jgi:LmbE family N-acetylglucosaminyl deacetylase
MCNAGRIATREKSLTSGLAVLLAVVWFGWAPSLKLNARPQASLQAVTDQITYNVGDTVGLRIIFPSPQAEQAQVRYFFAVRYVGEDKPVAQGLLLGSALGSSPGYRALWRVPLGALAGRYEIDLREEDPKSHEALQEVPRICSFVVHRQAIRIVSAEVAKPYYTSGDAISCSVTIENLSGQSLTGLRLEFSERYWPWIVQQRERVGTDISKLQNDITLKPHQRTSINVSRCAIAKKVGQPAIQQFAAVVWDHDRKSVGAIALTPLVFVNPPGVEAPRPYPSSSGHEQYAYPSLDAIKIPNYRDFQLEPYGAAAIHFETEHTLFASGSEAKVRFSLTNPSETPWRQVTVRARLLGPGEKELANHTVLERNDLSPHGPSLKQEVSFPLPPQASGLYQVEVQIADGTRQTLATNVLELGVNPLPKSVMLFCAHEDDDGGQMGFIRALVENHVPLHMVYFTSGDAGQCDRYFQHSCGPAEALNFGAIRMQESRAAMGHLGVAPENIIFLGLPDGGTGKIWYDHPHANDPYLAVLLASDHAPYDGLFRPNLPFARDSVVEATEEIIKEFQPEVIFTAHPPAEGHIDHIVNNYFVVKALQALLHAGAISPNLEVRVDRVFNPREHPATPYHYEDHEFYVSGEAVALAQEAGWFYQSQGGNREEGNLRTWNQLRRSEGYRKVLDWKEHEGWNEKE